MGVAKGATQAVFQVSLIGEVYQGWVVYRKQESGRIYVHLGNLLYDQWFPFTRWWEVGGNCFSYRVVEFTRWMMFLPLIVRGSCSTNQIVHADARQGRGETDWSV